MANSPFIENSKHPSLTKMVEDHFMTARGPDTAQLNPSDVKGANSQNALPPQANDFPFNTPDSGVNYVAPEREGHKV